MEPSNGRVPQRSWAAGRRVRARVAAGGAVLVAALSMPGFAGAQSVLGTIRGTLLDDQGDPMSGAPIRVLDEATGIQRETETTAVGDYEFPNLRAGNYRVEDNSPGFTAFKRSGVVLSAGDTVRVDFHLSNVILGIAATGESRPPMAVRAEELVITAEGNSSIQLESPAIEVGLDQQQLATLPRNTLDYQEFLYLTANVLGHRERGVQYLSGRSYGAYLLQDGQPSNAILSGAPTRSSPGLYSIDELKVFSNSFGAEYGGLATIVVTTRRGGNQLSGGAFYDVNADELNALTYPQKVQRLERGFQGSNTLDQRYGAWLGGPIRKQKTFFFVNYQGFDESSVRGPRQPAIVPSERVRGGDFSELLPKSINDPETGEPFPGNVIPPDRLDPAAQKMLSFYYQTPGLSPIPGTGLGRYEEFVNAKANGNRVDLRLDHEVSAADSVFARFTWEERNPGTFFLEGLLPRLGTQPRKEEARIVATSWVRIFSSRVLNELRGGWNLRARRSGNPYVVGEVADSFGIEVPAAARSLPGYPSLLFRSRGGRVTTIDDPSLQEGEREESSLSLSDTFTWLLGRHSLKLGGFYSRDQVVDSVSIGLNGLTGGLVFDERAGFTGNAVADFLLGLPHQSVEGIGNRGNQPFDATSHVFAAFVQDDWRVSNRLTLFVGLRYEVERGFRERRGLLANLDPEGRRIVVPEAGVAPLVTATSLPVVTAGEIGLNPALVNPDTNNLSPRLGFAYRLDENKTVVRGGAGLFYPTTTALGIRNLLSRAAFQRTDVRTGPGLSLSRAFSTGLVDSRPGRVVHAIPFDLETPEFLQYHLTLERELPGAVGLRISYLGAHADKLLVNRLINTLPASTVPFNPELAKDQQRLPFPTLATNIQTVENTGSGDFKALQLEASRRFRSGFGMYLAYTLSRTRTNARDSGSSTLGDSQFDPYDLARNEGPEPGMPRHRFVMDATWEIPVGRKRAASGLPGWLNALVGDWTVSTIVQARSGLFLTPFYTGEDQANTGVPADAAWRPDLVGDPSGPRDRDNFFNLAAFRRPAPGTLGNAPAGVLLGPAGWVVNVGFYKQVVSSPRFVLEARATLDNALNHPQFFVDPQAPGEFLNLTEYLVNEKPVTEPSGRTNMLSTVLNPEGFAAGRVVRVGLQLRF